VRSLSVSKDYVKMLLKAYRNILAIKGKTKNDQHQHSNLSFTQGTSSIMNLDFSMKI